MKPCSEVIKDILETADFGTFATDIFIASEPESMVSSITLYDEPGTNGATLEGSADWLQPRCQVRVRGDGYKATYTRCDNILKAIAAQGMFYEDPEAEGEKAVRWHSFKVVNGPIPLGKDADKRDIFVGNIRASKEEVAI